MSRSTEHADELPISLLAEYADKATVAKEFGVSTRTIERWVRLRLLPAPVSIGRSRLFHRSTIQEFLAVLNKNKGQRRHRG